MTKKILFLTVAALTLFACSDSGNHEESISSSSIDSTPSSSSGKAQFSDVRDGTKYVYVDIGSQTWMAENLNYAGEDGTMGRCAKDEPENCDIYGRLYTLDEMFCSSGCDEVRHGVSNPIDHSINIACPAGWHLPSTTEVEELWTFSDPNFVPGSEASGRGRNTAATKLKSASWGTETGIGTDELGFSGLPGGYCGGGCSSVAGNGTMQFGVMSFWWSHAYGAPVPLAKSWRMSNSAVVDDAFQSYSTSAFYVRCLKDKTPSPKTPEPAPQALACEGNGTTGQQCHYGKWKDYFTDERDNKEYPYVKIGEKVWMAANLDFETEGSVCYNDIDANCGIYGRLYNFEAAGDACPDGWRMPSDTEWGALGLAAAKLKAKSGWSSNGTDEDGFAALPGSYGNLRAGNYGSIVNFGSARGGFWWSATTVAANGAYIYHIGPTLDDLNRVDNDFSRMYSVRCVLD